MFIITLLLYKLLKLAACSDHFIWILPRQAGAKNTDVILIQTIFTPWIMSPPMQCVDIITTGPQSFWSVRFELVMWCCNNRVNYQVWQLLMGGHTYGWEHNTVLISTAHSCFNLYYERSPLNIDQNSFSQISLEHLIWNHKQFYFTFLIDCILQQRLAEEHLNIYLHIKKKWYAWYD